MITHTFAAAMATHDEQVRELAKTLGETAKGMEGLRDLAKESQKGQNAKSGIQDAAEQRMRDGIGEVVKSSGGSPDDAKRIGDFGNTQRRNNPGAPNNRTGILGDVVRAQRDREKAQPAPAPQPKKASFTVG